MESIPRRQLDLDFDPEAVPRDWYANDPYTTTFLDALSMLFPEGERFFVESVKQHKQYVTGELSAAVTGFIGQEAMHGKEHRAFNEMLVAHGYLEAPRVGRGLKWFLKRVRRTLSPRSQLAVTCGLEHFTAILAEGLLLAPRMRHDMHETVRNLWAWHALEESEHKAVAFDVYRAAGGSYTRRIAIMLLTTAVFFGYLGAVHARLMATRGVLVRPWRWARGLTKMWIWPAHFTRLVPAYLAYYRPGFHPDDRDTRALLATWRDRLFGDSGELREQLLRAG
jgi:predicted metal-dependent hydrolase